MNRDADLLVRNINMLSFCFLMCNKFNDMWKNIYIMICLLSGKNNLSGGVKT